MWQASIGKLKRGRDSPPSISEVRAALLSSPGTFFSPYDVGTVRKGSRKAAEERHLIIYAYASFPREELVRAFVHAFLERPALAVKVGIEVATTAQDEANKLAASDIILSDEVRRLSQWMLKIVAGCVRALSGRDDLVDALFASQNGKKALSFAINGECFELLGLPEVQRLLQYVWQGEIAWRRQDWAAEQGAQSATDAWRRARTQGSVLLRFREASKTASLGGVAAAAASAAACADGAGVGTAGLDSASEAEIAHTRSIGEAFSKRVIAPSPPASPPEAGTTTLGLRSRSLNKQEAQKQSLGRPACDQSITEGGELTRRRNARFVSKAKTMRRAAAAIKDDASSALSLHRKRGLEKVMHLVLRNKLIMMLLQTLACPLVGLWPPLEKVGAEAKAHPLLTIFCMPPVLRFYLYELSNLAMVSFMTLIELPIIRGDPVPSRDWMLLLYAFSQFIKVRQLISSMVSLVAASR